MNIKHIQAREVLDSRGFPTVEATVVLEGGVVASAMVPSGASTGVHEALELRDGDEARYMGKGVLKAVDSVNTSIREVLVGKSIEDLRAIDQLMFEADGTKNKSKLGANAILAVSLACARVAALSSDKPLYVFLAEHFGFSVDPVHIPVPMCNVLNGGQHADSGLDVQEFMICPVGASSFAEGIRWASETFHHLKKLLQDAGHTVSVGDEGGFAPKLKDSDEAYQYLMRAVEAAGYIPGEQIGFACDVAASEFYDKESGQYLYEGEKRTNDQMFDGYAMWIEKYPVISIEDPLDQDDWAGWTAMTQKFGDNTQIVGDDFLVTNPVRLKRGIEEKSANSLLVKVNQIGSLSETVDAIQDAHKADWTTFVSHRSGETSDTFIADLAVAAGSGQIKAGSLSRSERVGKYNRLLAIEAECAARGGKCEYRWVR